MTVCVSVLLRTTALGAQIAGRLRACASGDDVFQCLVDSGAAVGTALRAMAACFLPDWTVAGGGDGAAAAAGDDGGGDGDDAASLDPQMRAIAACAGLLVAGGVISDLGVIAAAASRGVEVAPRTRPLVPEVADAGASPAPPAQQLLYAGAVASDDDDAAAAAAVVALGGGGGASPPADAYVMLDEAAMGESDGFGSEDGPV